MAWEDRLLEAVYESPSGIRTPFIFEDVSLEFDKKTTAFQFPDADGTYIQDLGRTGYRYPFRLIFSGEDYDLEADVFLQALSEVGAGRLEHPIYGQVDVVPFGKVTRRDDLKTRANQAVFDLAFFETTGLVYPTQQLDPSSEIQSALDRFAAAQSDTFANASSLDTVSERATVKGQYEALLGSASSGLAAIASTQDDVGRLFNTINDSINLGIDVLIAEPLTLAFQTSQLIQTPGRALSSIQARLDAYQNLAGDIISGPAITPNPSDSDDPSKINNTLLTADLYASNYVAGTVVSAINTQFTTKPEAILAAELVLQLFTDVNAWRDENFQALSQIDTGGAYQQLQSAVALTAGFLVDLSFSLKQERRIKLDRPRNALELVAELYQETVDENLDFFIKSNSLNGDEILIEIPQGREIVYYV